MAVFDCTARINYKENCLKPNTDPSTVQTPVGTTRDIRIHKQIEIGCSHSYTRIPSFSVSVRLTLHCLCTKLHP